MKFENYQRILDVLISIIMFPFCLVIILLLSLVTLILDREPPLFCQTRIGRDKKSFTIFKMRTYSSETPILPTHEICEFPMLRVGKLYRTLKVDEVPQIINVILGDMSLVGPRPCLPTQLELLTLRDKAGIFDLRPGVTGLSQIRGIDMSDPRALVASDKDMINLKITTYFWILFSTMRYSVNYRKA